MSEALEVVRSRLRSLAGLCVLHPRFKEALDKAVSCIERGGYREPPQGLLIVGPSGTGKTTLARQLHLRYPPELSLAADAIRLLIVETPAQPSIKSLAEAVLTALGVEFPWKITAAQATREILKWIKKRRVQAIVIDEINHFAEQKVLAVRQVTDYLKSLINSTELPIILIGLEKSMALLDANEQLRRRFTAQVTLARFGYGSDEEIRVFRAFLRGIDRNLGFSKEAGLGSADYSARFFFATAGVPAHVMNIVLVAAEAALLAGRHRIEIQDLQQGFREAIWQPRADCLNPFSEGFQWRLLTNEGEPFHGIAFSEPCTTKGGA